MTGRVLTVALALAIAPEDRHPSVDALRLEIADAQLRRPRIGAPEVGAWVTRNLATRR